MMRRFLSVCLLAMLPCVAWGADDCIPTATAFVFGNYDTLNPTVGTSTISVTCDHPGSGAKTFNYTLALSTGSGSYASRSMTGTGDTLSYNLYTTAAYSSIWGDGTAGTVTVTGSVTVPSGTAVVDTKTIYGRISAPQNVLPGSYATATPVTVTVSGVKSTNKTDTFIASATVAAMCQTSATNLGFGPINLASTQTDASSTISVQCTKNSPYSVGLNAGTTGGATIAQRLMGNGANTMLYNLYTDSGRTSVWGNSSGSWVSGSGTGLASPATLPVYGRVASGQINLAVGTYIENTITVTVTY